MKITVEAVVRAPVADVWSAWTTPADILQWNSPSDDWHTTNATVDLRSGGQFSSRMEAKDGSVGFDFAGTYTRVEQNRRLEYRLGDERTVQVEFLPNGDSVLVRETFDSESTHSIEQQQSGWQAILDRFSSHVVAKQPR